jgi:hypothetical protein
VPVALALLATLCLAGCAGGEEDPAGVVQSPSEQVHEFVENVAAEGGEPAEEALKERRAEYEEAQEEREEDPETGEEAAAEGAEARDAWQSHEEEQEAAEEPAVHEHEPGAGRLLREG